MVKFDSGLRIRLKEARELRGWSIPQAANMLGVSAKTVSEWEAGKRTPQMSRLMRAAGVLGVAVVWLINGNDEYDPQGSSRSRIDKLAKRLDMAVTRSRTLNSELDAIVAEMKHIRALEPKADGLPGQ
jgi:transcriptional regulator with XRE-family HTH domain